MMCMTSACTPTSRDSWNCDAWFNIYSYSQMYWKTGKSRWQPCNMHQVYAYNYPYIWCLLWYLRMSVTPNTWYMVQCWNIFLPVFWFSIYLEKLAKYQDSSLWKNVLAKRHNFMSSSSCGTWDVIHDMLHVVVGISEAR